MPGKLVLIPSFIGVGSPDVLSKRTLDSVYSIKHFIVEREKTARAFLKAIGHPIAQNEFVIHELDKHSGYDNYRGFFNQHIASASIGLISEAGLPAVADPGSSIVQYAHSKKVEVVPLSGSSSIFLALMASGMDGQNFCFHGYLPIQNSERITALKKMEKDARKSSQIFMETPYRNEKFLSFLLNQLNPETRLCVAYGLEGSNEKIISQKVKEWKNQKIEFNKIPAIFIINK